MKTQDRLLVQKEGQLIRLKQENGDLYQKIQIISEKKDKEVELVEERLTLSMKRQIQIISEEQARKAKFKEEGFAEKERSLSGNVAELQKEICDMVHQMD